MMAQPLVCQWTQVLAGKKPRSTVLPLPLPRLYGLGGQTQPPNSMTLEDPNPPNSMTLEDLLSPMYMTLEDPQLYDPGRPPTLWLWRTSGYGQVNGESSERKTARSPPTHLATL